MSINPFQLQSFLISKQLPRAPKQYMTSSVNGTEAPVSSMGSLMQPATTEPPLPHVIMAQAVPVLHQQGVHVKGPLTTIRKNWKIVAGFTQAADTTWKSMLGGHYTDLCHFHKERENFLVCLVKLKTPRPATFLLEKMKDLKLVSLEGLEAHFYRKDPDFQQVVLNKKLVVEVGFGPEMEEFWRVRAVCEQSSAKLVALATSSSSSPSSGALLSARLATPSSAPKRKLPITAAESFQSLCSRSSNSAKRVKQVDALSGSSTSTKDMCQGDDASDSDEDDNEDDLLAAMEELNSEKGDRGEDSFTVNEGCNKKGAMDLSSCSRERLETLVRGFRGLYNKQLGANKRLEEEYLDAEKRCKAAEGLACAAKDKASMTRSHLFMLVGELKNTKSASVSVHTFRENNMVYRTYKGNVVDQQHSSSEGGAQQAPPNSKYIKGFYSKPRS